jgi:hypothetical protein
VRFDDWSNGAPTTPKSQPVAPSLLNRPRKSHQALIALTVRRAEAPDELMPPEVVLDHGVDSIGLVELLTEALSEVHQ